MNVYEVSKKYTREEFLYKVRDKCPNNFGLKNHECDNGNCFKCREHSIKDIQFKDEEDEIIEESKDNYNWIFNLEKFKNGNIGVNCETREESMELINVLISNGILYWRNWDNIYLNETYWCGDKTCYYCDINGMIYCSKMPLSRYDYNYKFSSIDFSQVWNKESIDEVALNNIKEKEILSVKCINDLYSSLTLNKYYPIIDEITTDYKIENDSGMQMYYKKSRFELVTSKIKNEFDITKLKSIILNELLSKRGFKTGDIVGDVDNIGIVYGNKIIYITAECIETINSKAYCEIIPVELVENNNEIQKALSDYLYDANYDLLEQYFIKIKERVTEAIKIYQVEYTYDSTSLKSFISDDIDIKIGDMVECQCGLNSSNYQYCKVKNIVEEELTEDEIKLYRICRKLSE